MNMHTDKTLRIRAEITFEEEGAQYTLFVSGTIQGGFEVEIHDKWKGKPKGFMVLSKIELDQPITARAVVLPP